MTKYIDALVLLVKGRAGKCWEGLFRSLPDWKYLALRQSRSEKAQKDGKYMNVKRFTYIKLN